MILKRFSNALVRRARSVYGWVVVYGEDGEYIQLVKKDFLRAVDSSYVGPEEFRLQYLHHDKTVYVGDELLDGPFDLFIN